MCHDLVRGKVQKVGNKPKIGGVHLHVSAFLVWSQSCLTVDFFYKGSTNCLVSRVLSNVVKRKTSNGNGLISWGCGGDGSDVHCRVNL